ncbi:hypothetical protein N7540_013004 [Penicillium herquei]|nr:hypothetical protein N7540_013004 [Penicillium herquei]
MDQNGIELLGPLIAEVERVIGEVDASRLERVMRASDVAARFSTILSGKFIGSGLGQYILVLMMRQVEWYIANQGARGSARNLEPECKGHACDPASGILSSVSFSNHQKPSEYL